MIKIRVECYSGFCWEETPRALWFGSKRIEIEQLLDRWISPDHRYFKIHTVDKDLYIIRHDPNAWRWELVFFRASGFENSAKVIL